MGGHVSIVIALAVAVSLLVACNLGVGYYVLRVRGQRERNAESDVHDLEKGSATATLPLAVQQAAQEAAERAAEDVIKQHSLQASQDAAPTPTATRSWSISI